MSLHDNGRIVMVERKRYVCIVCGRKFPYGQGIIVSRAGITLTFHSKSCLTKFFKLFIENLDEKEFKKASRVVVEEFRKLRELKSKPKVI